MSVKRQLVKNFKKMRVLILGGNGMLGHKLIQILQKKFEVWTTLRTDLQKFRELELISSEKIISNTVVEDFRSVKKAVEISDPDVIINAIGIIKQLPTSKDVIKILTINSIFPHQLANLAQALDKRFITISTDCVFNGRRGNYTEEDVSDAEDLYGKSKNLGEVIGKNCLTLRTSIIGRELESSHSLVEWFLSNRGTKIKGFTNAIYSGFPTVILAKIIADLIENRQDLQGLYQISSNPINKFDLLCLLKKHYRIQIEIEPSADFVIDRSLDSTKFREAMGFVPLDWDAMIKLMAEDKTPYEKIRQQMLLN